MRGTHHEHTATVVWSRPPSARFIDNRYPRRHEWRFDGGVVVPASSSPQVVRLPLSAEDAVDPEEAFVAALASCHMLFFLSHAARKGYVVDRYEDEAVGIVGPNAEGKRAVLRVTLRPRLTWGEVGAPPADELAALHHRAHDDCFIASSVKADVVVEPRV